MGRYFSWQTESTSSSESVATVWRQRNDRNQEASLVFTFISDSSLVAEVQYPPELTGSRSRSNSDKKQFVFLIPSDSEFERECFSTGDAVIQAAAAGSNGLLLSSHVKQGQRSLLTPSRASHCGSARTHQAPWRQTWPYAFCPLLIYNV